MVEQLFGSKTRVKLLQLFYSNPNRSFYVREITRKIDEQINSVRRELANLLSIGIISSENMNNRLYYEVDQKYDFYNPLSEIFGEQKKKTEKKTATPSVKQDSDVVELLSVGNVELALYTGQFTHDESSGVDLLVVGDVNLTKLAKFVSALEEKESKEIRYAVMPVDEYSYRIQVKDRFIDDVSRAKKQVVIDKRNLLTPVVVE
jgi:predicted transcriptional regulator